MVRDLKLYYKKSGRPYLKNKYRIFMWNIDTEHQQVDHVEYVVDCNDLYFTPTDFTKYLDYGGCIFKYDCISHSYVTGGIVDTIYKYTHSLRLEIVDEKISLSPIVWEDTVIVGTIRQEPHSDFSSDYVIKTTDKHNNGVFDLSDILKSMNTTLDEETVLFQRMISYKHNSGAIMNYVILDDICGEIVYNQGVYLKIKYNYNIDSKNSLVTISDPIVTNIFRNNSDLK